MNKFSLRKLIQSAGERMRAELNEQLVAHPGELGVGRENILRQFLRSYLPEKFEISTGFVFDSAGRLSKQLDIVIANALVCPKFKAAGGTRYFPCESVVAVGQVKSSLTAARELRSAFANLESVKALDRSANGMAIDDIHGEPLDNEQNYLHQIFTFLIITGRALSGERAREVLLSYLHERPFYLWPNVIIALDDYLITYCCDDGICPNTMHARGIALQGASTRPDILMRFYLMLGRATEVTRVSSLPYWQYLNDASGWAAEVIYSATDDPPPYLSAILPV